MRMLLILTLTAFLIQPILEPSVEKVYKKLDDKTLEVTTTTTLVTKANYDKAELQTELDHIPDRIAELQEQIDKLNERAKEIQEMLNALK